MTNYSGIFICEGSSDEPLKEIVTKLFEDQGVVVDLSLPQFWRLAKTRKDVASRIADALRLEAQPVDLIVVHRDADGAGSSVRRQEIESAYVAAGGTGELIPVIPVRMTEAWLLLDEPAIRFVAGNPSGRVPLNLPKQHKAEDVADPKHLLKECLLKAAEATGRRHKKAQNRFDQHRRQLLERLDLYGPVSTLSSWNGLVDEVRRVVTTWA